MVPGASLVSPQHIRIGLDSPFSQTLLKNEMDLILNEQLRVINISWDILLRNQT